MLNKHFGRQQKKMGFMTAQVSDTSCVLFFFSMCVCKEFNRSLVLQNILRCLDGLKKAKFVFIAKETGCLKYKF